MEGNSKKHKVFIADDEEINLKYFNRFLSTEYEVSVTLSCLDGLELVKSFNPDIILLDVHMPGINGFDFCTKLKLDKRTKDIPVIFVSSLADPQHIKTGLKVGAIDFISKPINKTETLARIKTHIAMGQVKRELAQSNKVLDKSLQKSEKRLNFEKNNSKKITARLAESENRFQLVFDSTPEAIIIVSADSGEIIDINPAGCELFGYLHDDIIGLNQNKLLKPSEEIITQNYFETKKNNIKGSDIRMFQNILIRKSGEELPVQNSSRTILIEGELYIFSIIINLSARKKMEQKLLEAKERAEELSKLKSFFIANISHELRTPLVGILGFSKLLEVELTEDYLKQMASAITTSGDRLLNTLKVLLEYSILESSNKNKKWEKVNINNIVNDVVSSYKKSFEERGLKVTVNYEVANLLITADEYFITEVVSQLLNNAITFTHYGSITITLKTKIVNNINYAVLQVKDTGIGISENKLNSIFEDFRQASEGYSREYEGLGLGLALVKKIVDLHGGEITVSSKENEGSLFELTLEVEKENH